MEGNEPKSNPDVWDLSELDQVFEKYGLKDEMDALAAKEQKAQEVGLKIEKKDGEESIFEKAKKKAQELQELQEQVDERVGSLEQEKATVAQFKRQLQKENAERDAAWASYIGTSGVTFDYKDFMINFLAEIKKGNEPHFDSGKPDTELINDVIGKATRSRQQANFDEMSYQAKKIIDANYQKFLERNDEVIAPKLLSMATNHELDKTGVQTLLKSFEEIDKYAWDKLDLHYQRIAGELYQFVKFDKVYDPTKHEFVDAKENERLLSLRELNRKKHEIIAGAKETIEQATRKRDWLAGYHFIEEQIAYYQSEIDRLQDNRWPFKGKKRQAMLENEKAKLMRISNDYFEPLIRFGAADVPTENIKAYLTDSWLISHEDEKNMAGFMNWMTKQLEGEKIDPYNKNVTIEIEYVPLTNKVSGKDMAYGIHNGTCSLKVREKKGVTNEVQHVGKFEAPKIYRDVPKQYFKTVAYLGLVKNGEFYTNIKDKVDDTKGEVND